MSLVEAAADRAEAEEVTGGEAGEDLGEEDVLGGEEVQHAHGGHTPPPASHLQSLQQINNYWSWAI